MTPLDPLLPKALPPDFTRPSTRYRRLVGLVGASLFGFGLFYTALLLLLVDDLRLTWTLAWAGLEHAEWGILFAPFAGVLLGLLLAALGGVHRGASRPDAIEATAEGEPELFALLRALAARTGAPLPHRVLLVPRVDAAVAYDSSIANLILPTRKNLILGLGLVNALTVGQLVAVLAHELGHFSQSSMRLGRWVYIAGGIIGRVAEQGGAGVALVRASATLDWRLAIVVAIYAFAVDLVRRAIGGLLWLVHLPERALSREMELHADKVAVSLTGSDALVEALARIRLADLAYEKLRAELEGASVSGRFARDLYPLHLQLLEQLALTRPELALPAGHESPDPARRVLVGDDAPPHMWATHPPGRIREENAKTPYLPAARDDRPAWVLFARPEESRVTLSRTFNGIQLEMPEGSALVDDPRRHEALDAGRAALYGEIFVTSGVSDPESLVALLPVRTDEELLDALARRHGPEVREVFEARRRHQRELDLLLAIASGRLPLSPSTRFRGAPLPSGQSSRLAAEVRDALVSDLSRIAEVHRNARALARAAAERLGPGWVAAHRDALALLHLLEHEQIRLGALRAHFVALLQSVSGGGTAERRACALLFDQHQALAGALARLGALRAEPVLPSGPGPLIEGTLVAEPDPLSWTPSWVKRFAGQLDGALHSTSSLTEIALKHLLDLEDRIEAVWVSREGAPAPTSSLASPAHPATPMDPAAVHRGLVIPQGRERSEATSQSFQVVKSLSAAAVVLLAPLLVWLSLHRTTIVLYNGTETPLDIRVGATVHPLGPGEHRKLVRLALWPLWLATEHAGEIVEEGRLPRASRVVYNAARRGVLVEQNVVYSLDGDVEGRAPELYGNPLFLSTEATDVFSEPPRQIQSHKTTHRSHLFDAGAQVPVGYLAGLPPEQLEALCTAALRFDRPSPRLDQLAQLLAQIRPERARALTAELRDRHPDDLEAHRTYQNVRMGDEGLVEEYRARAEQTPSAMGWYLYGRLLPDPAQGRALHQRALALDPGLIRARIALATSDAQLDRWDRVEEDLAVDSVPPELSADVWELRLRARRAAGVLGIPDDIALALPPALSLVRASLAVDQDAEQLDDWLERLPELEPELRLAAGDLEGARRALAGSADPHPDTALLVALSGPTSGWGAALAEARGLVAPNTALLAAAAARAVGLSVDPFLAALDLELRAVAPLLLATPRDDLDALRAIALKVDGRRQWVVYAAAAARGGDARTPTLVERVRRLSMPYEAPRW